MNIRSIRLTDFEPAYLHEDDKDLMILNALPRNGIGSLLIETSAIEGEVYYGVLLLNNEEISKLKRTHFPEKSAGLNSCIQQIIRYASENPREQYFFEILN